MNEEELYKHAEKYLSMLEEDAGNYFNETDNFLYEYMVTSVKSDNPVWLIFVKQDDSSITYELNENMEQSEISKFEAIDVLMTHVKFGQPQEF